MKLHSKLESFLSDSATLLAGSTVEHYRARLTQFCQFVGDRRCTVETVDKWTQELMGQNLGNSTVNLYRKTALAFVEFQVGKSRPRNLILKSSTRERGVFSDAELDLIELKAEGFWKPAVKIARATALRLGDVAMLRWVQVDMDAGGINLEPKKTERKGRKAEIPLSDPMVKWLAQLRMESVSEYVIPEMATHYMTDRHKTLSVQFLRLAGKAGIRGKSFHLIRNYCITKWLAQGITPALISTVTAQSIAQVMKYQRLTIEDKKKIFFQ